MTITESKQTFKITVGKYRFPISIWREGARLFFDFAFNRAIMAEIKNMAGAKFHGYDESKPRKLWSVKDDSRNLFQLAFLCGENPYQRFDSSIPEIKLPSRFNREKQVFITPYSHQCDMTSFMISRRSCIVAGEMGIGKTLSNIYAAEMSGVTDWWYVAPRGVIKAIERDLFVWDAKIKPKLMTYEGLTKIMKEWPDGQKPPQFVTFDEASRCKNPTAQRTQAAKALTDGMREEYGDDAYIVEMSGTPSPKSPADWYSICEIACPGFIKEGDIFKFKNRLGVIVQKESITGGVYPQLVTWLDNPEKCLKCGMLRTAPEHDDAGAVFGVDAHTFVPSKNEIAFLYERMKGLVYVKFKKDCLDLPDKQYRVIEIKPSASILRAASLIVKSAKTTIEGLTRLRELSDGFQYVDTATGMETCPRCDGKKIATEKFEVTGTCPSCKDKVNVEYGPTCTDHRPDYTDQEVPCTHCGGSGQVKHYERTTKSVACPKDDVLIDLLDEYDDVGRLVIYGGFTGTIDRVQTVCTKQGWAVIRVDRGAWQAFDEKGVVLNLKSEDYLSMFQQWQEKYPRVAFVANPGSGGMGLTLTASPVIVYYSNDFNGENRTQSEDRIHRLGMDTNRGATIIDVIHLPSDRHVLENLKAKRNLELMSLGEIDLVMTAEGERKV